MSLSRSGVSSEQRFATRAGQDPAFHVNMALPLFYLHARISGRSLAGVTWVGSFWRLLARALNSSCCDSTPGLLSRLELRVCVLAWDDAVCVAHPQSASQAQGSGTPLLEGGPVNTKEP